MQAAFLILLGVVIRSHQPGLFISHWALAKWHSLWLVESTFKDSYNAHDKDLFFFHIAA